MSTYSSDLSPNSGGLRSKGIFPLLQRWGSFVTFSHTVFALPFALSALAVCSAQHPVSLSQIVFILLALVFARTAAMGWNRIVDRDIDRQNERTATRALVSGAMKLSEALLLTLGSTLLFFGSAWMLGWHCLVLAPFVLAVLLGYSHAKRFTSSAHFVLGVALALAPGGVWYALSGEFALTPVPLMVGVALWVAGFDIMYSCQDFDFDREHGLFSVPSRFGLKRALQLSFFLHGLVPLLFVLFGTFAELGMFYFIGVAIFSLLLLGQHRLVSETDFSRIDSAFFTANGWASFLFFLFVSLDVFL